MDLAINIDKTEDAYDGSFFLGHGEWAHFGESQIEQLINSLRKCHQQKQSKLVKKVSGFAEKYSWSNTVKQLDNGISIYE